MKALIWVICIISLSLTIVLLGYVGIILGGIPTVMLYGAMFAIALKNGIFTRKAKTDRKITMTHQRQQKIGLVYVTM